MDRTLVAKEILEISKMLIGASNEDSKELTSAETSSKETAKTLSILLGKTVSGGLGGKYPFYSISGEADRVIVEKGGKFYFGTASDDGQILKLKPLKVANGVPKEAATPYVGLTKIQVKVARQFGEKLASPVISQAIKKAFDYETDARLNPDQASIMDGMLYIILDAAASNLTKRKRQI